MQDRVAAFNQRNVLTKVALKLHPGFVEYAITDRRGVKSGFNVKYELLPNAFDYRTFRSKDILVMLPLLIVAVEALAHLFLDGKNMNDAQLARFGLFMILFGGACVAAGYGLRLWLKRPYTVLTTSAGNLLIVQDSQCDRILGELQARRVEALKKLVVVDKYRNPWQELKKFKLLRDEAIISKEEFNGYREVILSSLASSGKADGFVEKPVLH